MDQFKLHTSLSPNLSDLISGYLEGSSSLKEFYQFFPNTEGLKSAAAERSNYPVDRELLVQVLLKQAKASEYSSSKNIEQIERLLADDVFTVTTGHQCCLLGGPMYFIYKIISVVKLAEIAEKNGVKAVPIFWMATEDHDFEEINHCWIGENKLTWDSEQNGAVGRFNLSEISPVLNELKSHFKFQDQKLDLIKDLEEIYSPAKTLSEATRDLCYYLFGALGIVVLDADDAELKGVFRESIKQELKGSISYAPVLKTSEKLKDMKLTTQVNPREINLFWLEEGVRSRIESNGSGFNTVDNHKAWQHEELLELVDTSPESFSPNVILRPVYQEQILPNLAYVGGPGELSYALQLKTMFEVHKTFYPMLLLRDMALLLGSDSLKKLERLDITVKDFKKDYHQLESEIARKHGTHESLVNDPEQRIEELLNKIQEDLKGFDKTLAQSAETEKKRIIKRLEVLKKKVLKADRRQHQDELNLLRGISEDIFPGGTPQERKLNWLTFFESKGVWVSVLESDFNPFEGAMKVFEQKN